MSKLLKFIVNLFLIATILIAVAILVPPLAGVTTTIVDTPSMNTNLPLGSITYSTDINVYDIKAGDEILKENDSSTFAYIIHQADPDNGKFMAVSAVDENGSDEEVILRNTVSKVAVVVPYIGYIVMAMHSIEGIVIIVLVVILMIILFILSELWKHSPDDEYEEEEHETEKTEEAPRVTAAEETEIDTAAIKEAVEENNTAVQQEDQVKAAAEAAEASFVAGAAAPLPETDKESKPQDSDTLADFAKSFDEARKNETDSFNYAQLELPGNSDQKKAEENVDPFEGFENFKAESPEAAYGNGVSDDMVDAAFFGAASPETGSQTLAEFADEMDKKAAENQNLPVIEDPDEIEMAVAEAEFFGAPMADIQEDSDRKDDFDLDAERFAPVARPVLDEIIEQAKTTGKDPVVKKDDRSGISIVDISEML